MLVEESGCPPSKNPAMAGLKSLAVYVQWPLGQISAPPFPLPQLTVNSLTPFTL